MRLTQAINMKYTRYVQTTIIHKITVDASNHNDANRLAIDFSTQWDNVTPPISVKTEIILPDIEKIVVNI